MRWTLAVVGPLLAASLLYAQIPQFPESDPSVSGGLIFIRQGGRYITSVGGVLIPRHVSVLEATPKGPVVTRFTMPSVLQSPHNPPNPAFPPPLAGPPAPAAVQVQIPDANGILYIDGKLVRTDGGVTRQLLSPPLEPGRVYPLHLRAAFKVGDQLLIEDRQVMLRAGETVAVVFDGSRATAVPLRLETEETGPAPRPKGK
jgi:uncharacterized protein (TIGR03000 family)